MVTKPKQQNSKRLSRRNWLHGKTKMSTGKRFVITLVILVFLDMGVIAGISQNVQAQSGPGGVSAGLISWLDAGDPDADGNSANNPVDGAALNTWQDKSSASNDATVKPGQSPGTYGAAAATLIAGNPVVHFNRVDVFNGSVYDLLDVDIRAGTSEDITIFSVYRPTSSPSVHGAWGIDNGDWDRFFLAKHSAFGDKIDDGLVGLGPVEEGQVVADAGQLGAVRLLTVVYDGDVSGGGNNGPPNGSAVYFDGKVITTFSDSTHPTDAQDHLMIGWDGNDNAFAGDLAEVIVYDRKLDNCELEKVNAYLGKKYGQDLFDIKAKYDWGSPFTHDINGIGSFPSACGGSLEIDTAASDIVTMSNPSSLDLNDFQSFANDNAGYSISTNVPAPYQGRLLQTWRVDANDGDVGTVTISSDLNAVTLPGNDPSFALLIDQDGDFSNASIVKAASVNGKVVTFNNVDFNHGDYFTIAFLQDPIKEAFTGCGLITFDSDAQGFRTASLNDNRTIHDGPYDAPHQSGSTLFRWESTGGNPAGHLRGDDFDGQWQELWTPVLTDPDFSAVIGQQIQFDYENNTGFDDWKLYVAVLGNNGEEYYYYFNDQLSAVNVWNHVTIPMVASRWHTGFEAGQPPSTPPTSSPPTEQQFSAVLSNLKRIAISLEGKNGSDTSRFDNFGRACDYGDAPEATTQFPTTGTLGARHNLSNEVRLGAKIDSEVDGQPTAKADGDDLTNDDDEDGVANLPVVTPSTTNYAVDVAVINTTVNAATLYGWIDANANGIFETSELASSSVTAGTTGNVTLNWSLSGFTFGSLPTYARFRITTFPLNDDNATTADERAQGIAADGEVEDYEVPRVGTIIIAKNAPGSSPPSFNFTDNITAPNSFSLNHGKSKTFNEVAPGAYTVSESDPTASSYELSGISCSDADSSGDVASRTATVNLESGEAVTCTFTNTEEDTITIEKTTIPAGAQGSFDFSQDIDGSGNFSLASGVSNTFSNVSPAGTYTITEADLGPDFELTAIECHDTATGQNIPGAGDVDTRTVTLDNLTAGERVHCTFTNTGRTGRLIVNKRITPTADSGLFNLQIDGVTAKIDAANNGSTEWQTVPIGTHTVGETAGTNTNLDNYHASILCISGSQEVATAANAGPLDVPVGSGEDVSCTITNVRKIGRLSIVKSIDPSIDPGLFDLQIDGQTSLADATNGTSVQQEVGTGTYAVGEIAGTTTDLADYDSDIVCKDEGGSGTEVASASGPGPLDVTVAENDDIVCTITNIRNTGDIIIKKSTSPAGGSGFTFNDDIESPNAFSLDDGGSKTFTDVPIGNYAVTEDDPGGLNFELSNITCDDGNSTGDVASLTALIALDPGEIVTCTFTNTEDDTIIVEKKTIPAGAPGSFDFTTDFAASFSLTGGQIQDFTNLSPGRYAITETLPVSGYDLIAIECLDPETGLDFSGDPDTGEVELVLAAGKRVHCTFTNRQRGEIVVVKKSLGGNATFPFTSSTLGNFSLTTSGGTDSQTFPDLVPGTYDVAESVPAGWILTDATCDDGSDPGNINLDPGELIICTFTDSKLAKITLGKETFPDGSPQLFGMGVTGPGVTSFGSYADGKSKTVSDALPGAWLLDEVMPSAEWHLVDISCSSTNSQSTWQFNYPDQLISVDLAPGDAVGCTFTNALEPPTLTKAFAPNTIVQDAPSALNFTIDRIDGNPVVDAGFTDNLPPGLQVADPAAITNTCGNGSSVTATPGGNTVTFSGLTLPDNNDLGSCTVSVDVVNAPDLLNPSCDANPPDFTNFASNISTSSFDTRRMSPACLAVTEPTAVSLVGNTAGSSSAGWWYLLGAAILLVAITLSIAYPLFIKRTAGVEK